MRWMPLAIMILAYTAFGTAAYLGVSEKRGATPFALFGMILALWATALPPAGYSPRDVMLLIRLILDHTS